MSKLEEARIKHVKEADKLHELIMMSDNIELKVQWMKHCSTLLTFIHELNKPIRKE